MYFGEILMGRFLSTHGWDKPKKKNWIDKQAFFKCPFLFLILEGHSDQN